MTFGADGKINGVLLPHQPGYHAGVSVRHGGQGRPLGLHLRLGPALGLRGRGEIDIGQDRPRRRRDPLCQRCAKVRGVVMHRAVRRLNLKITLTMYLTWSLKK